VLTTTLSHVEWVGGPAGISPGFPLQPKADPSEALWRKKHAGMTISKKSMRFLLRRVQRIRPRIRN
jgi:hypothetical protein